jgi:fatty-acyl-CoA synthase
MEKVSSDSVFVLWDIIHTVFEGGESPSETWSNIGKWIRNTHVKDGRLEGDKIKICLFGDGVVPLGEFVEILQVGGYDGYYTLEWPLKWNPELVEAEIAYPQYIDYMKQLNPQNIDDFILTSL